MLKAAMYVKRAEKLADLANASRRSINIESKYQQTKGSTKLSATLVWDFVSA
jgi:hypothetical protein